MFGTNLMMEAEEQVREIRDRLQLAKSRQKSYHDAKHRHISFEPGEYVYERSQEISDLGKACKKVSWPVSSYVQGWHSGSVRDT